MRGRSLHLIPGRLSAATLTTVVAGAAGSVGFMLHAGRRNPSRLLLLLMALWVISPFVVLTVASVVSKGWPALTRVALGVLTLALTLGSLAAYGVVALGPPRAQQAFVFIVVPPVSWLLTAIIVPTAALISHHRQTRRGGA